MILSDYKDFPPQGRIIGIDWGERRCGIAVSDFSRGFVFNRQPICIKSQEELIESVLSILCEDNYVGIVVGLPLHADGSDSVTTTKVRNFVNLLINKTNLPIIYIEENLTSVQAQEELIKLQHTNLSKEIDSQSAKIILENAISLLNRVKN